jgi:hypothetical protein
MVKKRCSYLSGTALLVFLVGASTIFGYHIVQRTRSRRLSRTIDRLRQECAEMRVLVTDDAAALEERQVALLCSIFREFFDHDDPIDISPNQELHLRKCETYGPELCRCVRLILRCLDEPYTVIEHFDIKALDGGEDCLLRHMPSVNDVAQWTLTLTFRTLVPQFRRMLSELADRRVPLWVESLSVESESPEEGICPRFALVLHCVVLKRSTDA